MGRRIRQYISSTTLKGECTVVEKGDGLYNASFATAPRRTHGSLTVFKITLEVQRYMRNLK
jgi:hypothetical protein